MNPSLFSSEILFHFFIFFNVFTSNAFSFPSQTIHYSDHCNDYAPEPIPTVRMFTRFPLLEFVTSHYTGGRNILDQDPTSQWPIHFEATRNLFRTNVVDTYKIQARLSLYTSNIYHRPSNFSKVRSNSSRVSEKHQHMLEFNMDGFWSVSTNELCVVGSASWYTKEGNPLKLNAVLKLKFPGIITLKNSSVSGILESLASPNDFDYFDPISMMGFPPVAPFKYNYTLVSNEECNVPKVKTLQDSVPSMRSLDICSIFTQTFRTYRMEYPSNCKNCSLFGEDDVYLPTFVSLYAIQCSREDKKLRFAVEFRDRRFTPYFHYFRPGISLIGEGTWNGPKDELCITACHILNQSDPLDSARVGDCSIKLTLWFPVRSIMKTHVMEGQIWSTKFTDDSGSFRMAEFQSFDHSRENYGQKYEYTQLEKVTRVCPKKKRVGAKHHSGYFGFGMSVKHKNMVSSGSAGSIFVGSRAFNDYTIVNSDFSPRQEALPPAAENSTTAYSGPVNITFEISFTLNISSFSRSGISSLNLSSTDYDSVKISAEGLYDDETGQICMVGCRNLVKNASFDCEIVVKFQLPQGNRGLIKGNIESLREKSDVLYFEQLDILSLTFTKTEARESIWTMDLEIIMVLISDTLMCVFTKRQRIHLKRRPEMVNYTSVLMMLILTLGHMIPLVLNFEAIFSHSGNPQSMSIGSYGFLEVNEVIVRIVTMLAFILQFRLLQLTWYAKKNRWIHEIRTLVICLSTYIISGLAILLMNQKNANDTIKSQLSSQSQRSTLGDLRSYAGLTIDGFLFPQLILNIFQLSKGNALSHSFYIGTTFVRLLPYAYDLYRGERYIIHHQFYRLYIYAKPRAGFYSPSWDIVIVCGGLVFGLIIFLQQCFSGRFMFPERFQEHNEYERVPVTSNET